jgi:hypothetical protein
MAAGLYLLRIDSAQIGNRYTARFETLVNVEEDNATLEIPTSYILEQNYPNPFNPVTTIRFGVPGAMIGSGGSGEKSGPGEMGQSSSRVKLAMYDILGREVAVLVNENREPGYYTVTYDAKELASGIYLYRLSAGDFTEVKKMILIR